jgi:spore photoproduct lyase
MNLQYQKITSINKIDKKETVINFTVDTNENFFANGILTHNCYLKRNKATGLDIPRNVLDIMSAIYTHAENAIVKKPNQTHPKYITYDIGVFEDFALHLKYHTYWKTLFEMFRTHPTAMASFATKFVNRELLSYNPEGKVRIRFSLMPQALSTILEPNTSSIYNRIHAINLFKEAGYDVHINFSPVVVYQEWLRDYNELFVMVNDIVDNKWKDSVFAEVIFLTHNEEKHSYNINNDIPGEELLWVPEIQESKTSTAFGSENVRYKADLKRQWMHEFTTLHDAVIPWNKIRYAF